MGKHWELRSRPVIIEPPAKIPTWMWGAFVAFNHPLLWTQIPFELVEVIDETEITK